METKNEIIKRIVDGRDYHAMCMGFWDGYPTPGEYYITGPQPQPDLMWYVGYVVQVRLDGGAFGSHCVLMRNPDGGLSSHTNQCYCKMSDSAVAEIRSISECLPEDEDYSQAFSIAGRHPEIGKVVEFKDYWDSPDNSPLIKITTVNTDGSKKIEIV